MNLRECIITVALLLSLVNSAGASDQAWVKNLNLAWTDGIKEVALQANEDSEDWKLKQSTLWENSSEKAGKRRFKGYLLSTVINNYLESIPYIKSSNVDLVVIEGVNSTARIPRALINKYSILLSKQSKTRVVLPRRTEKNLLSEPLPINEYEIKNIKRIKLTSYQLEYGSRFFIDADGNPLAERGNKRFVQACLGCHFQKETDFLVRVSLRNSTSTLGGAENSDEKLNRGLSSDWKLKRNWHDEVQGYPELDAMDQVGIRKYLDLLLRNSNETSQSMQTVKSDTAWREAI